MTYVVVTRDDIEKYLDKHPDKDFRMSVYRTGLNECGCLMVEMMRDLANLANPQAGIPSDIHAGCSSGTVTWPNGQQVEFIFPGMKAFIIEAQTVVHGSELRRLTGLIPTEVSGCMIPSEVVWARDYV